MIHLMHLKLGWMDKRQLFVSCVNQVKLFLSSMTGHACLLVWPQQRFSNLNEVLYYPNHSHLLNVTKSWNLDNLSYASLSRKVQFTCCCYTMGHIWGQREKQSIWSFRLEDVLVKFSFTVNKCPCVLLWGELCQGKVAMLILHWNFMSEYKSNWYYLPCLVPSLHKR